MSEFTGLGKVYTFTLTQQLKNKANRISLIILLVFCLISIPVMSLIGGGFGSSAESGSDLTALCIVNETDLPIEADTVDTMYEDVPVTEMDVAVLGARAVRITYTMDESGYHVSLTGGEEAGSLYALANIAQGWLQTAQLKALNVDASQLMYDGVMVNTMTLSEYLTPEQEAAESGADFDVRFLVTYIYAILVLILCVYATTYIVRSVVEEKASRLVELLMVSVEPLALLLGKILAMMTYIFGMFLAMAACVGLSYFVTSLFGDASAAGAVLALFDLSSLRLDAWTVVIVLVSLILSYSGFSLMAGLAGTCCSRIEEVDRASSAVMFTVLAGYLVSCVAAAGSGRVLGIILSLCPVVNVFCAPVQYTLGNIGVGWLLLSWLEQALIVAALAWLTARVYRQLILSRGTKIRFRQLLTMAKKEAA